jgi:putative oligomerization/nucleic acid binding protein
MANDAPAESAPEPEATEKRSRFRPDRRWAAMAMVVLASILLVVSVLALWIQRTALDTDTYSQTSSEVLQQPAVQQALSTYMVDQLYANVDVQGQLAAKLPPALQPFAGTAAAGLRQFAYNAALKLLQNERVQSLWIKANRAAHAQLVVVINGGGPRVSTAGGEVAINTSGMVSQLASRVGIQPSSTLAGGKIVILRSDQLSAAQTAVHVLKILAYVLPFVALALYAGAVWLVRDRRRELVRAAGVAIIISGIVLLILRNVAGSFVVNDLVKLPENRPAASAAWSVITQGLADTTRTTIGVGIIVLLWAWVSGPGRRARGLRHAYAPFARDHAGRAWAVFGIIILLLIVWAPTEAFRRVVPVIVLCAFAALGFEVVRRQSAVEFPAVARAPATTIDVRGWLGSHRRTRTSAETQVEQLERLSALHESGQLSDEEYTAAKRALLP